MSDRRGLFIVFEGVEGAGKSTHVRALAEHLGAAGVRYLVAREPGGTRAAEEIRRVVLDPSMEVGPVAELFLILAARAEFVREVVLPALRDGWIVLADRYELSTFAYQGVARGLGLERVRQLNAVATEGLKPDITLLLQVDPALGLGRKHTAADRMEREDGGFHAAVASAYADLATSEPNVITIDSSGPEATVAAEIRTALADRWPEKFGAA